jgi:hypothetical protein
MEQARRNRAGAPATPVLAILLVAGAVGAVFAQPSADAPGTLPAQAARAAQREELLRSWQDRVKIDGRDELRRVEIVFDYEAGVARRRVYDVQDQLLSDEVLADQPRPTRAEIAKAFDTVRRDPELGRLARDVNAKFDGGFLLPEGAESPCGPPARCLQVFMLSESRRELHRRSVVDVGKRGQIAHRSYGTHTTD